MPMNNNPTGRTTWTPEDDERLRVLWLGGKSATQIAVIFGGNITRNSVIGRVHRLKLNQLRPRPVAKPNGRGNPSQPKVNGIAARAEKRRRSAALAIAQHARNTPFREGALPPEDPGIDVTGLIGFNDRRIGKDCAWIPGDPLNGAMCCGKPVKIVNGAPTSWCPEHYARVYSGYPGQRD